MSAAGHRHAEPGRSVRVALLTVSDTRTAADDLSGATARALLEQAGHRVVEMRILPDEPDRVRELLREWLAGEDCEVVLINGGTGIAPRDRTYEAVSGLLERRLDGFGELFRMLSWEQVGSAAMLSRAVAGIARGKAVFSVPGSPRAVELALGRLILPELSHVVSQLGAG